MSGNGDHPSSRPSRVTLGAPGYAAEHVAHRAGHADRAAFDQHRPIRERRGALQPVFGEHHGGAEVVVEADERGQHVVGALRVEL